jgi:hypothetical protein
MTGNTTMYAIQTVEIKLTQSNSDTVLIADLINWKIEALLRRFSEN